MNELKTINIKGKEYVLVNERIKAFRNNYKDYALISEIVNLTDDSCVMKASVVDPQGKVVATGFARETVGKSPINKFAFVENCETSAWGRALGNFGIGIDKDICSADEMLQKINRDDSSKVELPLDSLQEVEIDSCRTKEELIKVCQRIKKDLGENEAQYRKSLVNAFNKKMAELQ